MKVPDNHVDRVDLFYSTTSGPIAMIRRGGKERFVWPIRRKKPRHQWRPSTQAWKRSLKADA